MAKLRVAGINFDHMHMGDLLREIDAHPDTAIAAIYDPHPKRMEAAIAKFAIPPERVFTDLQRCLASAKPDLAVLCSAPAEHANYVEAIAPSGAHILVEKPFASSIRDARRMIAAVKPGQKLAINWPLAWYRSHNTAKRLLDEGRIGELIELHYYDGNRGPLYHLADKVEVTDQDVERQKSGSWFYKQAAGGGSLIDYLGYGTTLGTWFHGGAEPVEITAVIDETPGIEVDQHSITVARYPKGLSKFETRWGTISDPWTQQPIPRCGFILVGSKGAISSYDYDSHITLQLRGGTPEEVPVDEPRPGRRGAIDYMVDRIPQRPAGRWPAGARALPDRPAHDRHRAGVRTVQAHATAAGMSDEAHALTSKAVPEVAPPEIDYLPPMPVRRDHPIALIGAGGISSAHLDAYRSAGFNVKVIASRTLAHAVARRDAFFPEAEATDDVAGTIARLDVAVVDITTHPEDRAPLIEASLDAGKHVLSQKPYVLDLAIGGRLADLADARGLMLAVNQQGRWAPHLALMREVVRQGLVGQVQSVHIAMHWDHSWVAGTHHDQVDDLILYDFAIHWFDFLASLIGPTATSVYATRARASEQTPRPPMLAQSLVAFPNGQAALLFDGATRHGARDRTMITGSAGTLESTGPDLGHQQVTLTTTAGVSRPPLTGTWFNDGFAGAMGALLSAVETGRPPLHNARDNLPSLALAFAAIASSHRGVPIVPGSIRSMADAIALG